MQLGSCGVGVAVDLGGCGVRLIAGEVVSGSSSCRCRVGVVPDAVRGNTKLRPPKIVRNRGQNTIRKAPGLLCVVPASRETGKVAQLQSDQIVANTWLGP